jgi:type VII secretion integral membrane protein EccD
MTDPTSTQAPVGTLLRVSVTAGDRRVDLGVPGNVATAEILPGLARTLGILDGAIVYGGYRLVRADGEPVDSARSLLAAGIEDGAVLTLEAGARRPEARVYDDVVEAVADAVESQYQPWTPRDSALGAAWAAVALLVVTGVLLLGADRTSALPPVIAGVGALLALVAGAVVARVGREPATGRILVLGAGVLAAVAGLTAGSGRPSWGAPAAAAGGALVLVGLLTIPALADRRELAAAPLGLGLALAASGGAVVAADRPAGEVLSLVVAIVVTASIGVPWLALSATPLRVLTPRTESEILLDPPPVDPARVRRQLEAGHRVQIALRIAVGLFALLATPAVVGTGVSGTVLLAVGFAAVLLSSRQSYSRLDVVLVVGAGLVGLAATLLAAALLHPGWRGGLVAAAAAGAALVVAVGLVAPRRRVALARAGDALEVIGLAVLLPLGVVAAGLV